MPKFEISNIYLILGQSILISSRTSFLISNNPFIKTKTKKQKQKTKKHNSKSNQAHTFIFKMILTCIQGPFHSIYSLIL